MFKVIYKKIELNFKKIAKRVIFRLYNDFNINFNWI